MKIEKNKNAGFKNTNASILFFLHIKRIRIIPKIPEKNLNKSGKNFGANADNFRSLKIIIEESVSRPTILIIFFIDSSSNTGASAKRKTGDKKIMTNKYKYKNTLFEILRSDLSMKKNPPINRNGIAHLNPFHS